MNLLLESFFESYGILIILVVLFGAILVYYFFRNKKYQDAERNFQTTLKVGDKVKTYSGFYGTVYKITETTDGKVITLQLGGDCFVDVDIRAIMSIDEKTEIVETEQTADATNAQKDQTPIKEEDIAPVAKLEAEQKVESADAQGVASEKQKNKKYVASSEQKSAKADDSTSKAGQSKLADNDKKVPSKSGRKPKQTK